MCVSFIKSQPCWVSESVSMSVSGCLCFAPTVHASMAEELAVRLVGDKGSKVTLNFERTNQVETYEAVIIREPVSKNVVKGVSKDDLPQWSK